LSIGPLLAANVMQFMNEIPLLLVLSRVVEDVTLNSIERLIAR